MEVHTSTTEYHITHTAIRRALSDAPLADLDAVGSPPSDWSGASGGSLRRRSTTQAAAFRAEIEVWRTASDLETACAALTARGAAVASLRAQRAALRCLAASAATVASVPISTAGRVHSNDIAAISTSDLAVSGLSARPSDDAADVSARLSAMQLADPAVLPAGSPEEGG